LRLPPTVALVGRPNVGKSTLFNRLIGSRRAIVAPVAGTTRDSLGRTVSWRGVTFRLVDTGGRSGATEDPLGELVARHGRQMMGAADLLVLVVDGREGLVSGDEALAGDLREIGRPVLVAVNKTDDKRARDSGLEFFRLAFEPVLEISAEHGTGIGELLDAIVQRLNAAGRRAPPPSDEHESRRAPGREPADASPSEIAVAIVGRPNVGKSSLVNRLLHQERMLVSEVPGTTRDAVDSILIWHQRPVRLIDTAGMRRPGRVHRGGAVELASVALAKRAIAEADVVALMIDAKEGATDLDGAIGGEADRGGRGVVILANKWDLVKERNRDVAKTFDDETRRRMRFLDYAPILHISATTGERVGKAIETIDSVWQARRLRVPTPALNDMLEAVTAAHPPVSPGRRHVRILYGAQVGVAPPTFVLFTNVATTLHFSYERFLVNQLRERFGFIGTPIRLQVRRRRERGRR
jgi:GTPase